MMYCTNLIQKNERMKSFDLYQIDAFADSVFAGNPACVVPLSEWLPSETMLAIARENGVAETAFFVNTDGHYQLRWFTPEIEMDLCGHATLATAHCIYAHQGYKGAELLFESNSGPLVVKQVDGRYQLDFPARIPVEAELPPIVARSLNIQPRRVFKSRDYLLVYDSEDLVKHITVDRSVLDQINLDPGGVVVTAEGDNCDFVSRYFTPQASILEDPVTGSSHCSLIPYWANILGRKSMLARQISDRGGTLWCELLDNRVLISGYAKTYLVGRLFL